VEAPTGAVTHRRHVMGSASLHPSYEGGGRSVPISMELIGLRTGRSASARAARLRLT